MGDRYEPASDFLKAIVAEEMPLAGDPTAEANMQHLVTMTRDADRSNRDWATMLLSQVDADTPEIRAALFAAADDENDVVRAEAVLGIAQRDARLALPLALKALSGDRVSMAVFEAVMIIADPILADSVRPWIEPSGNEWLDQLARDALLACEGGKPIA